MPSPRFMAYEHSIYQDIQNNVMEHLYPIAYYMGQYNVGTNL